MLPQPFAEMNESENHVNSEIAVYEYLPDFA